MTLLSLSLLTTGSSSLATGIEDPAELATTAAAETQGVTPAAPTADAADTAAVAIAPAAQDASAAPTAPAASTALPAPDAPADGTAASSETGTTRATGGVADVAPAAEMAPTATNSWTYRISSSTPAVGREIERGQQIIYNLYAGVSWLSSSSDIEAYLTLTDNVGGALLQHVTFAGVARQQGSLSVSGATGTWTVGSLRSGIFGGGSATASFRASVGAGAPEGTLTATITGNALGTRSGGYGSVNHTINDHLSTIAVDVGGLRTGLTATAIDGAYTEGARYALFAAETSVQPLAGTWAQCTTGPDGRCVFTGVPIGQYWVGQIDSVPGSTAAQKYNTITHLATGASGSDMRAYRFRTPWVDDSEYSMPAGDSRGGWAATSNVWANQLKNPGLPPQCGLDVALVLDLSGSVETNGLDDMKTAAQGFVDALTGTPSSVALFTFASAGPKDSTISGRSYPELVPVATTTSASTVKSRISSYSATGGTNWDAGLYQVAAKADELSLRYDVAIVLTDGNPTYSLGGSSPAGPGSSTYFREIERGVFSANAIKAKGTRVIAFGVGDGVGGNSANLQAISGPVQGSDYYQTANYVAAGEALRELALANCLGTVNVVKQVVPVGAPAGSILGATPAAGWEFSASAAHPVTPGVGTTDDDGVLSLKVTIPGGTTTVPVTVTETAQRGYDLQQVGGKNAVCTNLATGQAVTVTNDGELGFRVDADSRFPVTCTVYNRELPPDYDQLGVSVTTHASFDRDYDWTIEKLVDGDTRQNIPAGTDATFAYRVGVTPSAPRDTNHTVTGVITVTNPNEVDFTGVTTLVQVWSGAICVIDGQRTNLTVAAHGERQLDYTCTFDGAPAPATGTVQASVGWSPTAFPGTSPGIVHATDDFDFAGVSTTVRVTGAVAVVTDSAIELTDYVGEDQVGNVVQAGDGPVVFTYERAWPGVPGECASYDNTATLTGPHDTVLGSDTATVEVCSGVALEIAHTVDVGHVRTYDWTIDKNADASEIDVDETGSATVAYTVDVAPAGSTDSAWAMSGTVTVTNPNSWQDVVATVTSGTTIDAAAECPVEGGIGVLVPAGESVELDYSCTFDGQPASAGFGATTVVWDAATYATQHSAAGNGIRVEAGDWDVTEENTEVTVWDDKTDPANPVELGTVTLADGAKQFTYSLTHDGVRGECGVTYSNRAWIAETGQQDTWTVEVCWHVPGIAVVKQAWDSASAPVPGDAAELPYGSELIRGTTVTWTYEVANTGTSQLDDITVVDTFTTTGGRTGQVRVTCPETSLPAGGSMTCTGSGPVGAAIYGPVANLP